MKRYLGDGAYYTFSGGEVLLTAENGVSVTNRVYLGSAEIKALLKALGEDFGVDAIKRAVG